MIKGWNEAIKRIKTMIEYGLLSYENEMEDIDWEYEEGEEDEEWDG